MSTKAINQAIINLIGNGEPNSAEEARNAWDALLNELYPEVYYSTWNSPIKTQPLRIGFRYFLNFSKSGSRVFMNGYFTSSSNIPADQNVFEFTDPEFYNLNNGSNILDTTIKTDGIRFLITNGVFKNLDPITSNIPVYFNISFPTNP